MKASLDFRYSAKLVALGQNIINSMNFFKTTHIIATKCATKTNTTNSYNYNEAD